MDELRAYLETMPAGSQRDLARAEIRKVLKLAELGELIEAHDQLRDIERRAAIREIKFMRAEPLLRMYIAEPPSFPKTLLALLFHVKDVTDPAQVGSRQDFEIDTASARLAEGAARRWGMP